MKPSHQSVVGTKRKVYIAGRFIERIIQEDYRGLYIKLNNQRVDVQLDPHHGLYFIASVVKGI